MLLFVIPATSQARKFMFEEGYTFKTGNVEIKVERIEILTNWSGLAINLTVANNDDNEFVFPADAFEILNTETNEAYYSCTKDKQLVNIPYTAASYNVLSNSTKINPHRTIKGSILILGNIEELKSLANFDINFEKQILKVSSKR